MNEQVTGRLKTVHVYPSQKAVARLMVCGTKFTKVPATIAAPTSPALNGRLNWGQVKSLLSGFTGTPLELPGKGKHKANYKVVFANGDSRGTLRPDSVFTWDDATVLYVSAYDHGANGITLVARMHRSVPETAGVPGKDVPWLQLSHDPQSGLVALEIRPVPAEA